MSTINLPDVIGNEAELEDLLITPSQELIDFSASLSGPIVVLGAGGKMGPTLAARAQRAIDQSGSNAQIVAVSRFSDPISRSWLEDHGVQTIAADLLRQESFNELPDSATVIYLIGTKFGTRQNPSHTWAVNTIAPALAMQRYRNARFVALSTGNVYAFSAVSGGGSVETDPLQPVGEYAYAAVGRERIFDHCSRRDQTPVALIRLNYATDLRYGVIIDLATKVATGQPIDLTQGYFNCIWQGDANDLIIRSLALAESPPNPINLTSVETFSVREVAQRFGELMNRNVNFSGTESETALLSNASKCSQLLGPPATPMAHVVRWAAHWVTSGGRLLGKPTHFEVRDGAF
ncbi:MAG: NAD(P)-dependent oxidoreductase [Planctomycetales bacterium]|nr:NAD(P)-dependent oxidoreductase [Planctomycetales bacterium]